MLNVLQIVTLMLVAIAMACSLAHALELPGKSRLAKDAYFFGTRRSARDWSQVDWKSMRDKWEYSHVTRAVLSFAAVVLLACAIAAS